MPFKPGDTVKQKSGGPLMIVVKIGPGNDPDVTCEWCDSKGAAKSKAFGASGLISASRLAPIRARLGL
jgi:uncharacterized protein YodC (DUF2158 family)